MADAASSSAAKRVGPICIELCGLRTYSMCRRCRDYVCGNCLTKHDCSEIGR